MLLDLHLPDASGLSALAAILELAPGAAVVVLTGLIEQQVGLAAVSSGAQDYLVKGRVDAELFGRAIRYAVQRKQTEQAATALQAERLRAQENARLERGLLPGAAVGVERRWRCRPDTGPAVRRHWSAGTSTTWSRPPTAPCTR